MSQSSTDTALREIAKTLTPTAVSQYLSASRTWQLEDRQDQVKEIWLLPDVPGHNPAGRVMLPLATDYADFQPRFYDALRALSHINGWSADELHRNIVGTHADQLFVRLEQAHPGETIPLRQAETTIGALYGMIRAAAVTAASPGHKQRGGRLPGVVSAFLEEDVRLGHTMRGSFVFTLVALHGTDTPANSETTADPNDPAIFSRRVMETLARGLETTRDLAQGKSEDALQAPAQWGLSASLVESLEDMARPEELRSLELSFEWAAAEARPSVGAEPIRVERALAGELARVREHLIRDEEPAHRETLIGRVMSLARDDDLDAAGTGSAVISAEVDGRKRNVHMTLTGEDHEKAILAYRLKLPLIVTGDLAYERRAWRMTGEIEVDASIVQRGASAGGIA